MKNYCFFALLVFIQFSAFAQVKGIVIDSLDRKPIPYVTISVENENIGTSSEENGEFKIAVSDKNKKLVFSALGYERKTVRIADVAEVVLKQSAVQLDEVVISKRLETRQKEIGKSENQIQEAFDKAPRFDIKFFPYLPEYKKTKFLKQVALVTDSKIDDASFKIHFYSVGADGFPGEELLQKDFIVSVDRGVSKTRFNLAKFNLRMPESGILVGFEKLMIDRNKSEKTVTNPNTKISETQTTYYPFMLYNSLRKDFQFTFIGGKWAKRTAQNADNPAEKIQVYEPAITLILTN